MFSDRALADYDAQIRQSTQADEPGARAEADGAVVRWVPPPGQGQGTITWSRLDEATADAAIAAQVAFFAARRQPFEWKLYDYDQPADLDRRLLAAGLASPRTPRCSWSAETAGAVTDVPLPDGVTVREVTGAAGLAQMFEVHEGAFDNDGSRPAPGPGGPGRRGAGVAGHGGRLRRPGAGQRGPDRVPVRQRLRRPVGRRHGAAVARPGPVPGPGRPCGPGWRPPAATVTSRSTRCPPASPS